MSWRDNPLIFLTEKTWKYSKGNRKNVVLYFVLFVIANSIALVETLIIGWLLNVIQAEGVSQDNFLRLLGYLGLIVAVNAGFWLFHGPARVIETTNAFIAQANYKEHLLVGTMALPVEWHADHHSGDTIDKIEKGTGALYGFAENTFLIIESIVKLVGSYLALVYFNVSSAYIVVIVVVMTVWLILRFDKVLVGQYSQLFSAQNKISAKVYDALSNIVTVIILRVEKPVLRAIAKRMRQPLELFKKNSQINEMKWFLVTMCATLMIFFILGSYLYINLMAGAVIAIGTLYALYGYVERINALFYRFAFMYGDIVRYKTQVMNAEIIAKEFKDKLNFKEVTLGKHWEKLEISDLNFSYADAGKHLHLNKVNLNIKRGEKIALVGASGSGKTTLLKIIRGLYEPQKITISVDGKKLPHGFNDISHEISLIPQEPEIFATTIKENITVGIDRPLAEIKWFTDLARFTEVAERLPKKFDSSVVEKGVNLSGGEKQRLALARGLMASEDKAIVLLDEPTSSVDFRNEMHIYENVFKEFKDKAVISSIHRLHLLPLFDRIYVFSRGKVVTSGSFKDLLKNSPDFQEIWDKYNSTLPKAERRK